MGVIDWNTPAKKEIASRFVDHLIQYQHQYQDDIKMLIVNICNMSDFSHLKMWEDADTKIQHAKNAVDILRQQAKDYFEINEAREKVKQRKQDAKNSIKTTMDFANGLASIYERFKNLEITHTTPQARGFEFERILGALFHHFDLNVRKPFKLQGEQIDGAFTLGNEEFLLEVKYLQRPVRASEVHAFAGKINANLKTTLGLYISLGGYSPDCLEALSKQSSKSVILMDGMDLICVLDGRIPLTDMLKRKKERAAQTGELLYRVIY